MPPGKGPTPDFDRVTLKWAGVDLDGTPSLGRLELTYNRVEPMLDDDVALPVSIYPTLLVQPLSTTVIQVRNELGALVDKTVGYAKFDVPASNDPDITGSGGTYTVVERLTNGKGVTRTFFADKDAPNGEIWLNRISSITPVPGQVVSAITYADFNLLKAKVDGLTGGSGSLQQESVEDIVGAMMRAGAGTQVAYDDASGTVTITVSGAAFDAEAARDTLGAALRGSGLVSVTVDDATDTITIQTTATANSTDAQLRDRQFHTGTQTASSISDFTEAVQDAVATLLQGASGVTLAYNDAANTLTITGGGSGSLDAEAVRDAIGVALVGTAPINILVNDAADTITISLAGGLVGKQLLAAADAATARSLLEVSGGMVWQPYSVNGPRRSVPDGYLLVIVGGGATDPTWMLPVDIRWSEA